MGKGINPTTKSRGFFDDRQRRTRAKGGKPEHRLEVYHCNTCKATFIQENTYYRYSGFHDTWRCRCSKLANRVLMSRHRIHKYLLQNNRINNTFKLNTRH